MRWFAPFLAACVLAQGQTPGPGVSAGAASVSSVTVQFKKLSAVAGVIARRKDISLWTVELHSHAGASVNLTRESLLTQAPELHDFPNALAQVVLLRKASGGFASVFKTIWAALSNPTASSSATLAGILTKTPIATYAGIGMATLSALISVASTRVVDPSPYFALLLPETMSLPPNGGATYYLVTDYVSSDATVSIEVSVKAAAQSSAMMNAR